MSKGECCLYLVLRYMSNAFCHRDFCIGEFLKKLKFLEKISIPAIVKNTLKIQEAFENSFSEVVLFILFFSNPLST